MKPNSISGWHRLNTNFFVFERIFFLLEKMVSIHNFYIKIQIFNILVLF